MNQKYNPIVKNVKEGEGHFHEGFGVDCKRDKSIFEILSTVIDKQEKLTKKRLSFHQVISVAAQIAETDGEFALLCFDIGRQFEMQKMNEAASLAEKMIPALMNAKVGPKLIKE